MSLGGVLEAAVARRFTGTKVERPADGSGSSWDDGAVHEKDNGGGGRAERPTWVILLERAPRKGVNPHRRRHTNWICRQEEYFGARKGKERK